MVLAALPQFLERELLGATVWRWIVALAVAVAVYLVILFLKGPFVRRLTRLTRMTKTDVDDLVIGVLRKTFPPLTIVIALYAGTLVLDPVEKIAKVFKAAALVVLLVQVGLWANGLITGLIKRSVSRRQEEDVASVSAYGVIGFFARVVLWSLILITCLQTVGQPITALIAGFGVGGIAVALAAQNILGDVFNSVAILLDKPFETGDFIRVGDFLGIVERIGIKTTRVRSLSGEEVIFSNAELVGSRIKNYGRMEQRRILFTIGVTYQTALEKLKAVPTIVREIVDAEPNARFDRAHFKHYGDFSLNFEIVYYVESREYAVYMDIQQNINLAIFERFEHEGIEFAYPTQTVFVAKEDAAK